MDSPTRLIVLFALPEEAAPFLKCMRGGTSHRTDRAAALYTSDSRNLVVCCSGVGMRAAAAAAQEAIADSMRPSFLFVCGFAGGLLPNAVHGSLILADYVQNTVSGELYQADARSLSVAESSAARIGITLVRGKLATADRVLMRSAEKREFQSKYASIAVDMETAGAVAVAHARGVPWLAIRAVTDGCLHDMPLDFNALAGPDGAVDRGRIVRAVLKNPAAIPGLVRLGVRSAAAANGLAGYLDTLTSLPPRMWNTQGACTSAENLSEGPNIEVAVEIDPLEI